MTEVNNIQSFYESRARWSRTKLGEISNNFAKMKELKKYPRIVVYATGSYARLEAGEHSDLDVFFVNIGRTRDISHPKTKEIRLFGKILEEAENLKLPPFSNDSQYLNLLHIQDILENLGSPTDDHSNYFTARMLLLLEGYCVYGEASYSKLAELIVDSYFTDFDDHRGSFHPRFLMNDICRYWKTMLLNYENNRRSARLDSKRVKDPDKLWLIKAKQKVKNYKLKYSRMTTCFATLAALGSFKAPVQKDTVLDLIRMTPRERLQTIPRNMKGIENEVDAVLKAYMAFLRKTELSTNDLRMALMDERLGPRLNNAANRYGDTMFQLLRLIDTRDPKLKLMRNMVI